MKWPFRRLSDVEKLARINEKLARNAVKLAAKRARRGFKHPFREKCNTHHQKASDKHCVYFCKKGVGGARHFWSADLWDGLEALYRSKRPTSSCIGCEWKHPTLKSKKSGQKNIGKLVSWMKFHSR